LHKCVCAFSLSLFVHFFTSHFAPNVAFVLHFLADVFSSHRECFLSLLKTEKLGCSIVGKYAEAVYVA